MPRGYLSSKFHSIWSQVPARFVKRLNIRWGKKKVTCPRGGNLRKAEEDEGAQAGGVDLRGDREEAGDFRIYRLPLPGGEEEEGFSGGAEEEAEAISLGGE
jgi:hypothetical protein